ncbi:MAG: D-3-phosphoglycerate dehydrogenase [Patiriisocius sp.]|jgi:D-3-phosphoglycerate dehydrogenase
MKILANDGISVSGVEKLKAGGFEVITNNVPQEELINYINSESVTGILVRSATKVRQDIIDSCPSLKLIGRGGVGMDNIDVDYARSKGLSVINTPAASSLSVAELVMGHFFNVARGLHDSNKNMHSKGHSDFKVLKKKYAKGVELRGKTLGIIGSGRIGKALASYALGLGMKVIANDRSNNEVKINLEIAGHGSIEVAVPSVSLEELLAASDFISVHVPAQTDGKPVIGSAELNMMKEGVILANASRGGIIDEKALMEACNSGKVRAAALDVFVNEPTPAQEVLSCDHFSLSPHIGAATMEAQDRIGLELADQIISILN